MSTSGPIELPALPYDRTALEPFISGNTLDFHHGKHHAAYVANTNKLIAGTDLADASLEQIIAGAAGNPEKAGLFNNAAQIFNHTFYWNSMRPAGGGDPTGSLRDKIDQDLGGLDAFKETFATAAATQFGSGWAWLVMNGGKLEIMKTANADTPVAHGITPLLTLDVWEHAYYLDYQNRRPDYIKEFLDKAINWDFAAENLAKA